MENMNEIRKDWICNGIAGLLLAVAWYMYTKSKYNGMVTEARNYSIIFYFAAIAAFIAVWMLLRIVLYKRELSLLNSHKAAGICGIVWTAGIAGILLWNYVNEGTIFDSWARFYVRHYINKVLAVIIGLALMTLLYSMEVTLKNNIRYLAVAVCSFIVAISEYAPNPLYDIGGGINHYDSYTVSIFNALAGAPFSDINRSIYGHYAIIYYPFVKLLGGGTAGVALAISFFSICTILFMSLAGLKMIKDDKIFLLYECALLFVTSVIFLRGGYYQAFPHRCFFPALMFFLCACINGIDSGDKKYRCFKYAGWVIIAFALMWNFETGIVCAISYAIYLFLRGNASLETAWK